MAVLVLEVGQRLSQDCRTSPRSAERHTQLAWRPRYFVRRAGPATLVSGSSPPTRSVWSKRPMIPAPAHDAGRKSPWRRGTPWELAGNAPLPAAGIPPSPRWQGHATLPKLIFVGNSRRHTQRPFSLWTDGLFLGGWTVPISGRIGTSLLGHPAPCPSVTAIHAERTVPLFGARRELHPRSSALEFR
jgi:hypothetical protein